MGTPVRGEVIVTPFPFADNSGFKRRPALVLSVFSAKEFIVCAITSQAVRDDYCVILNAEHFEHGGIKNDSYIRPNYLFTVRAEVVAYKVGQITNNKMLEVIHVINQLLYL
jgi:mRNA interferase MazF